MNRAMIFLAVFAILVTGAISASADTLARDAMVTYSGTTAFSRPTSMERQACVDWLVHGGEMSEKCSKAVMKLVAYDPDAVTSEQRQALIREASGYSQTASVPEAAPVPSNPPQIVKQEDNTGKYIAIGVLGVIAGMVIHNNVGGSRSEPSYRPAPPRHYPPRHAPHHVSRPPVRHHQPPRPVSRPITRRPHCR
ncbi:MAG: hypothetical protein IJP54_05335 [Synergistaceae bacterium]|nr:hypothetical protein [Synergistaceae bacterium]